MTEIPAYICGPSFVGLFLVGQEDVIYYKPYAKISEVFHRSSLTSVIFDCEFDSGKLISNQHKIKQLHSSPYGLQVQNDFDSIPILELIRLARVELWFTVADSNFIQTDYNWTAQLSRKAEFTSDHLSIDLYDIELHYLASNAKLYFAAKFQVPYLQYFQEMSASSFICEEGAYLLLGAKGKYPETAVAFHPVAMPIQLSCSSEDVIFDVTDLEILTVLDDGCDSTSDLTYRDLQCLQYRTVRLPTLQTGLKVRITVKLRQLEGMQTSNIAFSSQTLKFKANLADANSQSTLPNGVQLDGQALEIDGRSKKYPITCALINIVKFTVFFFRNCVKSE